METPSRAVAASTCGSVRDRSSRSPAPDAESLPHGGFHLDEAAALGIKVHDHATHSEVKSTANVTVFDTAKFMWEMNYAKDNLLLGLLKLNF